MDAAAAPLAPSPRTLEIGCGTGFLTRALRSRIPVGSMLATDIAPAMIARCRTRIGAEEAGFQGVRLATAQPGSGSGLCR
ncbi:methyltransferase domain-containing protein [Methylobacterium gnaphalii]|uniref:Methyltransferase domain-containing protein n=2 Tax=Methylobacterium gnaphalii TaxID=1010610 RepID=A0A512JLL9_9HYPH|nr:methyltransferase domain-containing protein [Methylobacterium gnaphalii]GEP10802.1 hypothetical protein MGN01_26470 [Methylobacterium gnaphalii]GJD71327.1 Trans-aconitate 2-methyltransferase [Methylobacterium gnaphalii]GLS49341.1 hypothetical protein GCM10007885_21890 [Methylobacterium gnaphalii]